MLRSDPDVSTYDLGFDAGQMFTFKTHSTSVMALRCQDIPIEHRSKARFCHILMIIPGPKEPDNVSINYLAYFDNFCFAILDENTVTIIIAIFTSIQHAYMRSSAPTHACPPFRFWLANSCIENCYGAMMSAHTVMLAHDLCHCMGNIMLLYIYILPRH